MVDYLKKLASVCDHTELKLTADRNAIKALCYFAQDKGTASVCIRPSYVRLASEILRSTPVAVCTVIGFPDNKWPDYFPTGYPSTSDKMQELKSALMDGAEELGIVANLEYLLAGNITLFRRDLRTLIQISQAEGKLTKVIFENCFIPSELKEKVYQWVIEDGADFLKTSTGMGIYGSTTEDLYLTHKAAGSKGVKAAGGINAENYLAHLQAALGMQSNTPFENLDLQPSKVRIGESSLLSKLA